jgi:hypothetical protein
MQEVFNIALRYPSQLHKQPRIPDMQVEALPSSQYRRCGGVWESGLPKSVAKSQIISDPDSLSPRPEPRTSARNWVGRLVVM